MDWLDEKIQKLFLSFNSLRGTLFLYLFFAIIMTALASLVSISVIVSWEKLILREVVGVDRWFDFLFWSPNSSVLLSENMAKQINSLETIRTFCPFVFGFVAVLWVTEDFYRRKIKRPLGLLHADIQQMQVGKFDQPIALYTNDDFEVLAKEFEDLRKSLASQQREIKHLHQEQRKINAAFSHDLRTPLTVIQNNAEMIEELVDSKQRLLLEKPLNKIKNNVSRLTAFSKTMQEIQRLEELPIQKTKIKIRDFSEWLKSVAEEERKVKVIKSLPTDGYLIIDRQIVQEALENVISNAKRYAQNEINLTVTLKRDYLTILVKDDGLGFSKQALNLATAPYFSQSKEQHFGLGLTICDVLTRKHGGILKIGNGVNGGAIVSLVFHVSKEAWDKN